MRGTLAATMEVAQRSALRVVKGLKVGCEVHFPHNVDRTKTQALHLDPGKGSYSWHDSSSHMSDIRTIPLYCRKRSRNHRAVLLGMSLSIILGGKKEGEYTIIMFLAPFPSNSFCSTHLLNRE
jgi:hypothetical protein